MTIILKKKNTFFFSFFCRPFHQYLFQHQEQHHPKLRLLLSLPTHHRKDASQRRSQTRGTAVYWDTRCVSAESFIFAMQSNLCLRLHCLLFIAALFYLLKGLSMLVRNHSLVYPAVKVYLFLSSCKKEFQEKHINDINNSYRL